MPARAAPATVGDVSREDVDRLVAQPIERGRDLGGVRQIGLLLAPLLRDRLAADTPEEVSRMKQLLEEKRS